MKTHIIAKVVQLAVKRTYIGYQYIRIKTYTINAAAPKICIKYEFLYPARVSNQTTPKRMLDRSSIDAAMWTSDMTGSPSQYVRTQIPPEMT